jgi:hypothetical protein
LHDHGGRADDDCRRQTCNEPASHSASVSL